MLNNDSICCVVLFQDMLGLGGARKQPAQQQNPQQPPSNPMENRYVLIDVDFGASIVD